MGVRQIPYYHEFIIPGKNGFLTPWLQPGEHKRLKIKRLQPLKGLNAEPQKMLKEITTGLKRR